MALRIISTGGTFDKHYDEIKGALSFGDSHLPEIMARARLTIPVEWEALPPLDSLDMTDADRQLILQACMRAREECIVITHGTDTMSETAELLGKAMLTKTIVLTGAMIPYEIAGSDALFNFGHAFGIAQAVQHGVYIAMNGQVFSWNNVRKDKSAGIFTGR